MNRAEATKHLRQLLKVRAQGWDQKAIHTIIAVEADGRVEDFVRYYISKWEVGVKSTQEDTDHG